MQGAQSLVGGAVIDVDEFIVDVHQRGADALYQRDDVFFFIENRDDNG